MDFRKSMEIASPICQIYVLFLSMFVSLKDTMMFPI
jgi:hypothetical protein